MTGPEVPPSVHASAVLVGDRAVLIRGRSGTGKSRLALDLVLAGRAGQLPAARLVGDDRVYLTSLAGQLVVRAVPELAGLIEIRGLGLRHCDFVAEAVVGLVVDLGADDGTRMPGPEALKTIVLGVDLARIPVGPGYLALPLVAGWFATSGRSEDFSCSSDCSKGIGNHMSPTIFT